jgi:hypothetical protein
MQTFVLILSQVIFSFSRTLNVRYTAKDNVLMGVATSTVIKMTWLVSTSIGVNSAIERDWVTLIIYVGSGVIGDYLSFQIKVKK